MKVAPDAGVVSIGDGLDGRGCSFKEQFPRVRAFAVPAIQQTARGLKNFQGWLMHNRCSKGNRRDFDESHVLRRRRRPCPVVSWSRASRPAAAADLLNSCPPLAPAPSPAGSLGEAVDTLAALEMRQQGLPGMTIEIAKRGVPLYARAYGYADLASCRPARIETPYQIGSVTKQFTAAAILQLQHAG